MRLHRYYSLSYFFSFQFVFLYFFYFLIIFSHFLHHVGAVKWPIVKEQTVCVWDISCWFSGTLAWWIARQKTPNNSWFATCSLRLNNVQHSHRLCSASNDSVCELWNKLLHQTNLSYSRLKKMVDEKMNEFHVNSEVTTEISVWQIVGLWCILIITLFFFCFF